ncbi:hypothetical protein OTERR_20000 [Oryzomicrobium terrae]|uniref:Thioredoxin domain-containing protein n=1 Tax=Oryzomicrobium terrae TaxID=1735038 RepID=A0A5C1E932_9RHOO|nr:TlpA disulfide reductase family protein [Oryzomicrobium terrae]QEL65476.1 hypothetical protein OTERR_20000 [Oryzomicrobium terrae]
MNALFPRCGITLRRFWLATLLTLTALPALAGTLTPLQAGDYARLKATRSGKPFVVTLWGVDCPYCKGNLAMLAAAAKSNRKLDLVVIATDTLAEADAIAPLLRQAGLAERRTWVFGDAAPERLRFEIDRQWRGEMPRTYLFDADHQVTAVSGALSEDELRQWQRRNGLD